MHDFKVITTEPPETHANWQQTARVSSLANVLASLVYDGETLGTLSETIQQDLLWKAQRMLAEFDPNERQKAHAMAERVMLRAYMELFWGDRVIASPQERQRVSERLRMMWLPALSAYQRELEGVE